MAFELKVILTPAMAHLYDLEGANVVVIDILRATTSMCEALNNGAKCIIPVSDIDSAKEYQKNGYKVAAERNGIKVDGFDFGNSPLSFTREFVFGHEIVFTTTNGTRCIEIASQQAQVYIGSFLNISALTNLLTNPQCDLFLFCAGWKDKFNLEDTLFAGALAKNLQAHYHIDDDATIMAMDLYEIAQSNLMGYVSKASHYQRFDKMGNVHDSAFCLQMDTLTMVPVMRNNKLVPFSK